MRKWLTRIAVAAALILIALLVVVYQIPAPGIRMDQPLPPGRVRPQLVNGYDSAMLLAPDGSLWAWGGTILNLRSVFPRPTISQVPLRVGSDSDWTQVACGWQHTVALKNDGSLWAWGWNFMGAVGSANFTNRYGTPTRIGTESNWTQICAGNAHSLALKNDGSLWAWGLNSDGQLGDGTTNSSSVPIMIGIDRDWRIIAAGRSTSFALKNNGTLWCWGEMATNNNLALKQIGSGTNWLAISAFDNIFMALKTDGTLWQKTLTVNRLAVGFVSILPTRNFTQIGLDSDWSEVYAGEIPFYARKKDGSWWVGRKDYWRQLSLGISIPALPSPQHLPFDFDPWAFATGNGTTLLLGKDGKLWTWGKRLGAGKPSATREKIQALLAPMMRRFPSLGYLIKSDIDQTPHLLWELPPEVRRSLGTGSKGSTNDLTAGRPADASHE